MNGEIFSFIGDDEASSMMIYQDGSTLQSEYGVGLQVVDKAGNVIPYRTGDTEPDSITMTFTGIIDPADVAAIVLNGTEVPLTK